MVKVLRPPHKSKREGSHQHHRTGDSGYQRSGSLQEQIHKLENRGDRLLERYGLSKLTLIANIISTIVDSMSS